MSVILTSCRHTKQRAIARALKKRAEKQKLKRLEKLKKEAELQQLEAEDPSLSEFCKMWSFSCEGTPFTVVLYLACDKDTVDIFCNEEEIMDVITNVSAEGATFDFVVGSSYKARITCQGSPDAGLVHQLTIDGYKVPEVVE